MRHRPTECRLQAAGEGVKQLGNRLVVWRIANIEIQQPKDSRYVKNIAEKLPTAAVTIALVSEIEQNY